MGLYSLDVVSNTQINWTKYILTIDHKGFIIPFHVTRASDFFQYTVYRNISNWLLENYRSLG